MHCKLLYKKTFIYKKILFYIKKTFYILQTSALLYLLWRDRGANGEVAPSLKDCQMLHYIGVGGC